MVKDVKERSAPSEEALAREVSRVAKLSGVRLISCSAENKILENMGLPKSAQIQFSAETEQVHGDKPRIQYVIALSVVGKSEDDPPKECLLIKATFQLVYALREDLELSKEHVLTFLRHAVFDDVWPYLGEFVHSITGRMGLPTFRIPRFEDRDIHVNVDGESE